LNKSLRRAVLGLVTVGIVVTATACGTAVEPDVMAFKYSGGSQEGAKFDKCYTAGQVADPVINDTNIYVLASERTWRIANDDAADSKEAIEVGTKPDASGNPGAKVKVFLKADFFLNTNCDDPDGDGPLKAANSPLIQWWETVGRRYGADVDPEAEPADQSKDEGWANSLKATLVPVEQRALQDSGRNYSADDLDSGANGSWAAMETNIEDQLTKELNKNGNFYCGPGFDRGNPSNCPPIRVTITDVFLSNPEVAAAREAVAAAELKAKANKIAAESKLAEARILADAAKINTAFVQLEIEKIKLQQVEACAKNEHCTVILGGGAGTGVNISPAK
jgi:hypothetical protein